VEWTDRGARRGRVTVTEDDLLALPFVFELSPELVAELEF
jgi:hypothetical protein